MTTSSWLNELPVLGRLPVDQAAAKLREVGEDELADALEAARHDGPQTTYGLPGLHLRRDRTFRHTGHAIGHLQPAPGPHEKPLPIDHAGNIAPDPSLKDARITVTLDALHVADYPGRGPHRILFDFAAHDVHFNATYRAAEGEHAAVIGRLMCPGLHVGDQGLHLQATTVNVHNEDDETFLQFLETDAFKHGLQLATTWQPALVPLSAMTMALTKAIAGRNRNVAVQTLDLGLDFRAGPHGRPAGRGRLHRRADPESREQIFRWQDWVYDPTTGQIVSAADPAQPLPYNSFTLGVSR